MHSQRADGKEDWIEPAHRLAVRVIKMGDHLPAKPASTILARQIIRSVTSVVANLEEARACLTPADMLHRTNICRKEAKETLRWLLLIRDAELLPAAKLSGLIDECSQMAAMLTTGVKKLKAKHANKVENQ